jgi:hypothetical protein
MRTTDAIRNDREGDKEVGGTLEYESVTGSRYVKRVQPSLLLQTPQDPIGHLSMMESFILVLLLMLVPLLSMWKEEKVCSIESKCMHFGHYLGMQ